MRITTQGLLRNSVMNINRHFERLAENQRQLSSGKRVHVPSDDPIATQRILRWRKVEEGVKQYQRNINTGNIWMRTTESTIVSVREIAQTAYETALVAGNSLVPQETRDGMAQQIETLLKDVLRMANVAVEGNYIFAGHATDTRPFSENVNIVTGLITSVDYNGDGGARDVQISDTTDVTINALGSNDADDDGVADYSGSAVFRDANLGVDIFDTLINLRDDLTAGNTDNINNLRVPELADVIDNLTVQQSIIGLGQEAVQLTGDILGKEEIDVSTEIDSSEQADLAKVVADLNYDQTIYQASLFASTQLFQGTLFDFLR
ncbi:MAG: flagellar hook-associated protein 3 [Candidatus Omnitrophica bacterium]|nr:flagellar hook-associated protein 3 [Candidatus Omnitrophota bacterium]